MSALVPISRDQFYSYLEQLEVYGDIKVFAGREYRETFLKGIYLKGYVGSWTLWMSVEKSQDFVNSVRNWKMSEKRLYICSFETTSNEVIN